MSTIYMQIKGVEGDVTAQNYQGWIRLSNATKRNTRNNVMKVGQMSNRSGNAPEFSEIAVIKQYDSATNQLFEKSCIAKTIPQVLIHVCTNDNDTSPYCKMELSDVLLSEHVLHLNEHSRAFESFQMSFSKIQLTHIAFDKTRKPSSQNLVGYDLAKATTV